MHQFLNKYVGEAIETVHLLPMYPYTSDDGFSVVDYRKINPELGDWEQIKEMSSDYRLMFDAVINHISKSSEWFEGYLKGEEPYKNYFITCDAKHDTISVEVDGQELLSACDVDHPYLQGSIGLGVLEGSHLACKHISVS